MDIPFSSFVPMEQELNKELRDAFERVLNASWYIDGCEDQAFERVLSEKNHRGFLYAV